MNFIFIKQQKISLIHILQNNPFYMKIIVFTVLFMVSFISYANDNKLIKKVDTLSCQEIEINDSVFLKAISIFKDSLQNRFFCDYCTSVFINFENDEQIQFGVKSIYKTNLFIGLSNWTKDSTPSEMALCSFVWNDIRFLTRKDILVKLGVDYKVLNSNRKLNINDFLKKGRVSKSCEKMEKKFCGMFVNFYFNIKDNMIVNPYFVFEKAPHTGE